jgi:PTS system nitrogen regulatory IIA component
MDISDFLAPDDTLIDVRASDKTEFLQELSKRAASKLNLDPDKISRAILGREELGSTGIGGGVAIPHVRVDDVKKPFGMLVRLRKPIDFESIDEQPIDLVFLLLLPQGAQGEQLNVLAAVARRLRDPLVLKGLRGAGDQASSYDTIIRKRSGRRRPDWRIGAQATFRGVKAPRY